MCHRALIFDRGRVTAELAARRALGRAPDGAGPAAPRRQRREAA